MNRFFEESVQDAAEVEPNNQADSEPKIRKEDK